MAEKVILRKLGGTEIEISPIGLGVMQFSGGGGIGRFVFRKIPQEEKNEIIRQAIEGGINWFDTAELYGFGNSERGLSQALTANQIDNDGVLICDKWWPLFRTAGNIPRTIDKRLGFLGGYTIDLYLVHQPISYSSPEAEMEAMAGLVKAGKVRSIGVSNFNPERMRRAYRALAKHGLPLTSNQVQYNLLNRRIESNGILETAKELGMSIVCWGPLASGLLSGRYHQDEHALASAPAWRRERMRRKIEQSRPVVEALQELGEKYHATPAQVALNWLIHFNGETVVAIPGASKPHQACESAGAMQFRLAEEDLSRLDLLTRQFL